MNIRWAGVFVVVLLGLVFSASQPTVQAQVGMIHGEVVDTAGNPIKDVTIRIEGLDVKRKYKTKTDKEGKFVHAGVSLQGVYRVIAEKEGFQSDYVEGLRPGFSRNEERGKVDFTLKAGEARKLAFELTDEERAQIEAERKEQEKRAKSMKAVKESFNEGLQLYNAGQYEEAEKAFQAALEADPEQPAVWANLGMVQARLKRHDDAVSSYNQAIQLDPENVSFYQNRGSVYSDMGDTVKAQQDYEKAASLSAVGNPKDAAISYYNMGVTHINSGNNDEAKKALQKALEFDPDHAESHYQLGICLIGTGQNDQAVQHLKKFVELKPAHPDAEVAKALIQQLGN